MVIVASLLAFVSLFAIWLNRQVLNTDNWTKTSSDMLADPVIRDQVALYLVDQLYSNVDVTEEISAALPPRLDPLAPAVAGALRQAAERAAKELLARPRAQQAWEEANRRAHVRMLQVLDGGTANVSTTNGEVVLDLKGLLTQLSAQIGVGGRLAAALPPEAAQIEIVKSDQLSTAQDVAKGVRHLPLVLIVLSLGLFLGALFVAPANRRTTVRGYGIGLIVAGVARARRRRARGRCAGRGTREHGLGRDRRRARVGDHHTAADRGGKRGDLLRPRYWSSARGSPGRHGPPSRSVARSRRTCVSRCSPTGRSRS